MYPNFRALVSLFVGLMLGTAAFASAPVPDGPISYHPDFLTVQGAQAQTTSGYTYPLQIDPPTIDSSKYPMTVDIGINIHGSEPVGYIGNMMNFIWVSDAAGLPASTQVTFASATSPVLTYITIKIPTDVLPDGADPVTFSWRVKPTSWPIVITDDGHVVNGTANSKPLALTAPTIVTSPASRTVTSGTNVSFSVVATGSGPLSYQWRKDGQPISVSAYPSAATATLNLGNVTTAAAGVYTVLVTNTAPNGAATSGGATLTVNKIEATVSAIDATFTYDGVAKSILAPTTNPAGLPVTIKYTGALYGATVSPTNADVYAVKVTIADSEYTGSTNATLTINKAPQTIVNFAPPATKSILDGSFALSATASSGLSVSFSTSVPTVASIGVGNIVNIVSVGSTVLTASQAGNENYLPAPSVPKTLQIGKADQTIAWTQPFAAPAVGSVFTLAATASSGLPVSYATSNSAVATITGNILTIVAAGDVTITATQGGDDKYNAASPVARSLSIVTTIALGGTVYLDVNVNHLLDAADLGLVDVAVELRSSANVLLKSTTTVAGGSYTFSGVSPSTPYFIVVTPPPGFTPSTATEISVPATTATTNRSFNAGLALDFEAMRGMTANGFTIGYWKNNLTKAATFKATGTQQTLGSLCTATNNIIGYALPPFADLTPCNASTLTVAGLNQAAAIMGSTSSDPASLLKKQLLASEYNYANNAWLNGNQAVTAAFIYWGEYVLVNASSYGSTYVTWAKDWFDAYNNSHGGLAAGPVPVGSTSIASTFNNTTLAAGNYLWFNAVVNVGGRSGRAARVEFNRSSVQMTVGGLPCTVDVPDAVITFDPAVTIATTTYDDCTDTWRSTVPASYTGDVFLGGVVVKLPGSLPGGLAPTWSGRFVSTTTGLTAQWSWAAAVYTRFNDVDPDLNGVKAIDGSKLNAYANGDNAGTPENFKNYVTSGAKGGGGSNYTGSYSSNATVNVGQ
jgi:hypothetical protein